MHGCIRFPGVIGRVLVALVIASAAAACSSDSGGVPIVGGDSDTGVTADTGTSDTGTSTDTGGTDVTQDTTEPPPRPPRTTGDTPPETEATPPTPPEDRDSAGDDRISRDQNPDREPPPNVAPAEVDAEFIALGDEYVEYCWDSCDLVWICFEQEETEFDACYEDCVDDLERIYTGITFTEDGADCLDAIVEAIYCETSFADDAVTIDDICDDYEEIVTVQTEDCDPEYLDVEYYCFDFEDTTTWFFEEDLIGNIDVEYDFEVNEALDGAYEACTSACAFEYTECYEDDGSFLAECEVDCGAEIDLADDSLDGSEAALDCADAIWDYFDCYDALVCDDYYDEEDDETLVLCEVEADVAYAACLEFFEF